MTTYVVNVCFPPTEGITSIVGRFSRVGYIMNMFQFEVLHPQAGQASLDLLIGLKCTFEMVIITVSLWLLHEIRMKEPFFHITQYLVFENEIKELIFIYKAQGSQIEVDCQQSTVYTV